MRQKILTTMLLGLVLGAVGCAKRPDNQGMGAGADTTGIRDTTTTMAPVPPATDTTTPPQK